MKVLIVRFSAIGDCVMTAWAATALRLAIPEATIVWAVQERCAPVIDTARLVDRLHVFPREQWKEHRWSPRTWRDQFVHYTALRKQEIDVGFDFQGHSKTALCLRLAGCKERYASRATDALAARLNRPIELVPEGPHEVQCALALVRTRFDVVAPERPLMPTFPTLSIDQRTVTIQTGAGEPDKLYPVHHWNVVAKRLLDQGCQVVAVGGPHDPRLEASGVQNEVGRQSLEGTLALVAASRLHLAADTGTGHAAAAYGVPVVSVFGRTDPERFRPWTDDGRVLLNRTDPGSVDPEDVFEAAVALMEESPVTRAH